MNRLPVHCHNEAQKGIKEWCLRSFLNPLSSAERRRWADYSNPYLIWGTYQSFVASNAALLTCRRRDHFLRVSSSSSVVDGGVRGLSVYGTRSSQQGRGRMCFVVSRKAGWCCLWVLVTLLWVCLDHIFYPLKTNSQIVSVCLVCQWLDSNCHDPDFRSLTATAE